MFQNVLFQTTRARVGFLTMRAFVTLAIDVHLFVSCHIFLHCESLMTNITLKRLVCGMRLCVPRQTILSVELLTTHSTLEQIFKFGLGSGLDVFMPAQV